VIFSWITNASYAVSLKGRVVLLDTYVHRAETVPGRTPFVVEDLLALNPEAIFLGHGHGDHADNAAFVAGNLDIPIYASAETCIAMQTDATNLFNAGRIPVNHVECREVTSSGSTPGAEIVKIAQLEPIACITAFRHLHSTTTPLETTFPIVPVLNIADPRDPQMYPPGTPHSFPTSGVGGGGPISIFYQFVMRGDNRFTFACHNTTGAIKEGCGLDKCWTRARVDGEPRLPGQRNARRHPVSTSAAAEGVYPDSPDERRAADVVARIQGVLPEAARCAGRPCVAASGSAWVVDPNDYLKPQVYDPQDNRWAKANAGNNDVGTCQ